jgi:predicted dehydrogenase
VESRSVPVTVAYRPRFPAAYRPGIGIVACGRIVRKAHLPAYRKHGLRIVGVYDPSPEATRGVREAFGVERIFDSLDALLADPEIAVVDVATLPGVRIPTIRRALAAGKHVLAQKPLARDVDAARAIVAEARGRDLKLAVNQNGRWAPAWRVATLLIARGLIGEVHAVTHLFDFGFGFLPGTPIDRLPHGVIYDYAIHWIDITRCWLGGKRVRAVRARDYRVPAQPAETETPWGAWIEITYDDGSNGLIRGVGVAETGHAGHPFWIHGSKGTIRGSVLGMDYVELETGGVTCRYDLTGEWFPDGFAGTMGELLCAIAEEREPSNSAADNLLTLQLTLAACQSADRDGAPVPIEGVPL